MDALKMLGGLLGNNATGGNLLGSILKGAVGGGGSQQRGGGGSLGGLGSLLGGGSSSGGGSLGGLGSLLGGSSSSRGGGSNILGSILTAAIASQVTGAMSGATKSSGGGAGGLLGAIFGGGGDEQQEAAHFGQIPQQEVQDQATLLIRAMCNAAKADGQIDEQEQKNIISRMGELDQSEIDFLRKEFAAPLDLQGFVSSVPRDLGPQVYTLSVMAVKVDTREEATYLQQLAQGLGLDRQEVSSIHQQLGLA